jgi:uncharacterized membrane protein
MFKTPTARDDPAPPARRWVMLGLACAGLGIAAYLTLYQLGVISTVWDPAFGSRSSVTVLGLADPVPDALAGVLAYATEIVLLLIGGADAWRRRPWISVALGGVLLVGAGVSVLLIILQPVLAAHWCIACLTSAAISLALFALGIRDARAAIITLGQRP